MKWLQSALVAACLASVCMGQETFTPLSWEGEDIFESRPGLWLRPNLGEAADVLPLKMRMWATRESVTGGVALKILFEPGSTGQFSIERSAEHYPRDSAGITFYAKASRPLTLGVGGRDFSATASVTTEWHKFDLPWETLGRFDWQTYFTVRGPITERTWLIIDRLGSEGPQFIADPAIEPQAGPDQTISSKDILYGREHLNKTLERLKGKRPVKIIAIGDSVTAGAQVSRGTWNVRGAATEPFYYFAHFATLLREHFEYEQISAIGKGVGGQRVTEGRARLEQDVLALAGPDDVVIIQFGANDMGWGGDSPEQWKNNLRTMIRQVRRRTDQIIVMSPTVGSEIPAKARPITAALKALVDEEKVAGVDITLWSMYRGEPFAWALLANEYHPDMMGHIWMAEMMAPLFTGKERTYPE